MDIDWGWRCGVERLCWRMYQDWGRGMTHPRVTKAGQLMGNAAAVLADQGKRILDLQGLGNVPLPLLRHEMCKTCACQPGSVPNGCLQTQMDFLKAAHDGKPFRCHAPADGRICKGWLHARAALVANPLPTEITEMLDQWDYSPPDEQAVAGMEARK